MQTTTPNDLSITARLRATGVGCAVGVATGCVGRAWSELPQEIGPSTQVVAMLFAAGLSGVIGAIVLPIDLAHRDCAVRFGVKKGLWAAALAVLVAGCVLSLNARSAALEASTSSSEAFLKGRMWLCLLVSLTAIIPGLLFGCFGGLLGCLAAGGRLADGSKGLTLDDSRPWLKWLPWTLALFAAVGMLSPLSFIGRPAKVDPPPPEPLPPMVVVPPPSPPAFHFVPSPALATAKLGQVTVAAIKTIQGVDSRLGRAFTPDYAKIAYCDVSLPAPTITIFDLNRFKAIASITVPYLPQSRLEWSHDFQRLVCVSGVGEGARVWIIDPSSGTTTTLPRPKNGDVPSGAFAWWSENELAFFPSDEGPLFLDLELLLLKPLDESTYLKKADEVTAKRWRTDGAKSTLPLLTRWSIGLADVVEQIEPPPRRNPSAEWTFKANSYFAFTDDHRHSSQVLREIPIGEGSYCYWAPDASKVILIHEQKADVVYMQPLPPPKWCLNIEMPMTSQNVTDEVAERQIASKELCVIAYRPLINPLTGKTVGPDYEHVKAVLRLNDWTATKATFAITQLMSPLDPLDVIATPHTWRSGRIVPWKPLPDLNWWTLAGDQVEQEVAQTENELETPRTFAVNRQGNGLIVTERPRTFTSTPQPTAATSIPTPPPTRLDPLRFLEQHHKKASTGDLDGLMADYADTVDFLDKGRVPKSVIAADEASYRRLRPRGTESIKRLKSTQQQFETIDGENLEFTIVLYTIEYRHENTKGDWRTGEADLEMKIKHFESTFQIVGQKAKVHDVKQGSAKPVEKAVPKQTGPPAIKVRLPGPVWASTSIQNVDGRTYEIHEAVSWDSNTAIIHRTYRELINAQTPAAVKAKHPNGVISMQTAVAEGRLQRTGNGFTIYIGRQGWVQEKDARVGDWNVEFEQNAAAVVGSTLSFRFVGNDIESGGGVLKMVKDYPKK